MSLVPHIASLYTNPQLLARDTWSKSSLASPAVQHITLTSTSVLDEDVTKLLARRLKDLGISCDWCSTSCNHSTAGKYNKFIRLMCLYDKSLLIDMCWFSVFIYLFI